MLIEASMGKIAEKTSSKGYYFDSSARGKKPYVIVQYTLSGEGRFVWRGVDQAVPAGWMFIAVVPEHAIYYFPPDAHQAWTFSWLNFEGETAVHLWKGFRQRFGSLVDVGLPKKRIDTFHRLISQVRTTDLSHEFDFSRETYGWMMELAEHLDGGGSYGDAAVRRAVSRIKRQPDRPLGVKEMAALSGLTREHFTRIFRSETGQSPAQYRRETQMKRAAELVTCTRFPMSEIARQCGYPDSARFGRAFRNRFGCSPLRFRKERKKTES
ncbi:MAG: helix-turn-helix domain-containing protein [Candidatus Methylacidiphilales bacterium]